MVFISVQCFMFPLIPLLCAIKILIDNPISNNSGFKKSFSFSGYCFPIYFIFQRDILNGKNATGLPNEIHSLTVQMFISMHASYKSQLMRMVMAQLSLS